MMEEGTEYARQYRIGHNCKNYHTNLSSMYRARRSRSSAGESKRCVVFSSAAETMLVKVHTTVVASE